MEEYVLIKSAQGGDLNDFRLLMERHAQMIWRVMRVLVADPALVEDRMQESWVEIWRKLPDFTGAYAFRSWLLAIIATCAKKRMHRQSLTFLEPCVAYRQEGKDLAARGEVNKGLDAMLKRLTLQQSRCLQLHLYAGLDIAEIALVLHAPLREVKAYRQGAFHSLKTLFAEDRAMTALLRRQMESRDE